MRHLDDGNAPIHNNWVENQIRPWAIGQAGCSRARYEQDNGRLRS